MTGLRGALANLGYEISDQTVGNVLRRHGLPPAPERKRTTTWAAFIRTHVALLAGTDFFTAEVLTLRGLVTYYVLFFIHLESRRVDIAGLTVHPDEPWMKQIARNVTMEGCGVLRDCRYLLHDRDTKYTRSFSGDHCVRWGRTARAAGTQPEPECLRGALGEVGQGGVLVQGDPFGERSLRRATMSSISMSSGITRGRATFCCFLGTRTATARRVCGAASDWVGSCAFTIGRRLDGAPVVSVF